jgi:hypothetical protein
MWYFLLYAETLATQLLYVLGFEAYVFSFLVECLGGLGVAYFLTGYELYTTYAFRLCLPAQFIDRCSQ